MIIRPDSDPAWPNWWIVQCSKCTNEITMPLPAETKGAPEAAEPHLVRHRWQVKTTGEGFGKYVAAYCHSCKESQ